MEEMWWPLKRLHFYWNLFIFAGNEGNQIISVEFDFGPNRIFNYKGTCHYATKNPIYLKFGLSNITISILDLVLSFIDKM